MNENFIRVATVKELRKPEKVRVLTNMSVKPDNNLVYVQVIYIQFYLGYFLKFCLRFFFNCFYRFPDTLNPKKMRKFHFFEKFFLKNSPMGGHNFFSNIFFGQIFCLRFFFKWFDRFSYSLNSFLPKFEVNRVGIR